jgi:hypothetical protein
VHEGDYQTGHFQNRATKRQVSLLKVVEMSQKIEVSVVVSEVAEKRLDEHS